jgi:hypothetical protein
MTDAKVLRRAAEIALLDGCGGLTAIERTHCPDAQCYRLCHLWMMFLNGPRITPEQRCLALCFLAAMAEAGNL